MAEVCITSRPLPSSNGAWRGIERYEIWSGVAYIGEDEREANLLRWCEISYRKPADGPLMTGYHGRNRRVIAIEDLENAR